MVGWHVDGLWEKPPQASATVLLLALLAATHGHARPTAQPHLVPRESAFINCVSVAEHLLRITPHQHHSAAGSNHSWYHNHAALQTSYRQRPAAPSDSEGAALRRGYKAKQQIMALVTIMLIFSPRETSNKQTIGTVTDPGSFCLAKASSDREL